MEEKTRTIDGLSVDEKKRESASFQDYARVFQYADGLSWILNVISLITSIGAGVTLPLMTLVFGDSIGEFNNFSTADIDARSFNNTILNSVSVLLPSRNIAS